MSISEDALELGKRLASAGGANLSQKIEARKLRKGYGDNLLMEDLNFDQPEGALALLVEWAQERPTLVVIEPPQGKSRRPDPALFAGLDGVLVARTFKPDGSLCDEIYRLCGGARCTPAP